MAEVNSEMAMGFHHRKKEILQRLRAAADKCKNAYSGHKELASESDTAVATLCVALEEAFVYGLRQTEHGGATAVMVTAASLLQNMTEIVTGNAGVGTTNDKDDSLWEFIASHLTPHERERYENLKCVWTASGKARSFIRAALNECALQRCLLTWLGDPQTMRRYFTPWSVLVDSEASRELVAIIGGLSDVLFALTVDSTELNVAVRTKNGSGKVSQEPIIYAPTPTATWTPVVNTDGGGVVRSKRKINPVERPIRSASSTEDLLTGLSAVMLADTTPIETPISAVVDAAAEVTVFDPIEPALAFLKEPLLSYGDTGDVGVAEDAAAVEEDNKSDSSSQYSSTISNKQPQLEEKYAELSERYALLQTRVAELTRENRLLVRRLKHYFAETAIQPNSSLASNFIITIPTVQLLEGKRSGTTSSYCGYEVHITMQQPDEGWVVWQKPIEHWVVCRRYSEFHKLHKSLLRSHPQVASVELPPKKYFNMNTVFVEERRQQLQIYLLNLVEALPQVDACKTKRQLQKVFPFFREP